MKLDDAFRVRRIRSIIGHEPPRSHEFPFMYRVGDAYRVPDQREPVGTIEAIAFVENYLGDRSELWFELVVGGEALERINVKDVGAVGFFLSEPEAG